MTKAALKKQLHKTIDSVSDENILKAVYTLLNNSLTSEANEPFSLEEYAKRQKLSLKQIKEGKVKTQDSIKRKYM